MAVNSTSWTVHSVFFNEFLVVQSFHSHPTRAIYISLCLLGKRFEFEFLNRVFNNSLQFNSCFSVFVSASLRLPFTSIFVEIAVNENCEISIDVVGFFLYFCFLIHWTLLSMASLFIGKENLLSSILVGAAGCSLANESIMWEEASYDESWEILNIRILCQAVDVQSVEDVGIEIGRWFPGDKNK